MTKMKRPQPRRPAKGDKVWFVNMSPALQRVIWEVTDVTPLRVSLKTELLGQPSRINFSRPRFDKLNPQWTR